MLQSVEQLLTHHSFEFDKAGDEVVKPNATALVSVSLHEGRQRPV